MSDINERIRSDYDNTPYESFPFPQTSPGHMAAIAHLFGLTAPARSTARILELGCASGGNIIPHAIRYPKARIVGIDLSPVQVATGQRIIREIGLDNIELKQGDVAQIGGDIGMFDYIICHGVFSWVPAVVQDAILRICRDNLNPDGIAYISYNCYPGWKFKEVIRDAMILRGRDHQAESNPLGYARGMIEFLKQVAPKGSLLGHVMDEHGGALNSFEDYYLTHEYLESINKPIYFKDFVERAGRVGLGYLADAATSAMFASNYGEQVAKPLLLECGDSQVKLEQHLDFVSGRTFRQTLLVHQERISDIRYKLDADRLKELHMAAFLVPRDASSTLEAGPTAYGTGDQPAIFLNTPAVKAAAAVLTEYWPATVAFPDLIDAVLKQLEAASVDPGNVEDDLISLIELLVIQGRGKFSLERVGAKGERQNGDAVVPERWRQYALRTAAVGTAHMVNIWHEAIVLDPLERHVVERLDGRTSREMIVDLACERVREGAIVLHFEGKQVVGDEAVRENIVKLVDGIFISLPKRFMVDDGRDGNDVSSKSANLPIKSSIRSRKGEKVASLDREHGEIGTN